MRRVPLALILAGGLLLRLLYLAQAAELPFFEDPAGDSAVYIQRAGEILQGNLLPDRPFFYGSILYPYLLAAVQAPSGGSLLAACLVQVVVGSLSIWLLSRLARRVFGRGAALPAAALTALYGPFAFLEADILGVAWAVAGLGAGALWLLQGTGAGGSRCREGARSVIYLLLAGLALGFSATERPNLLLLAPLAALWAGWRLHATGRDWRPRRGALRPAAGMVLVIAGAATALAPVPLLNRAASGRWILLTTSGGINLFIGNHEGATGTFDEPWSAREPGFTARHTDLEESSLLMAAREAGRELEPWEASSWWAGRAWSWIRANPGPAAALTLRKARLLCNASEFPNHLNHDFMRLQAPALGLMFVGFGVLAPLALVGLGTGLLSARRRPGVLLLALMAGGAALSVLPFFGADRYRAPMVPPLAAAAAGGILALWRAIRRPEARRDPKLLAILLPALLLAVETWSPLTRPDLSRDYWLLARAWTRQGDHRAAARAYEAALAEAGEDGVLLNNLGLTYERLGRPDVAEATLRRAVRAGPDLAYPHKNLGLLLIARGRAAEARRELEAALGIDGEDPETLGALALLLAESGEREAAISAYEKARRLDPADPRLARLREEHPFLGGGEVSPARPRP